MALGDINTVVISGPISGTVAAIITALSGANLGASYLSGAWLFITPLGNTQVNVTRVGPVTGW